MEPARKKDCIVSSLSTFCALPTSRIPLNPEVVLQNFSKDYRNGFVRKISDHKLNNDISTTRREMKREEGKIMPERFPNPIVDIFHLE